MEQKDNINKLRKLIDYFHLHKIELDKEVKDKSAKTLQIIRLLNRDVSCIVKHIDKNFTDTLIYKIRDNFPVIKNENFDNKLFVYLDKIIGETNFSPNYMGVTDGRTLLSELGLYSFNPRKDSYVKDMISKFNHYEFLLDRILYHLNR